MRKITNIFLFVLALLSIGIIWYNLSLKPSADVVDCLDLPALKINAAGQQRDLTNAQATIIKLTTLTSQDGTVTISSKVGELVGPSASKVTANESHDWYFKVLPDEDVVISAVFVNECGQDSQSLNL